MIMERKRLDDLNEALKQADEQIKNFRLSTKTTAAKVQSQHRLVAAAKHAKNNARADGIDPSKQAEICQKKLMSNLEDRLDKMRIRLSQTENHNEQIKMQINDLRRHRMTSDKCLKRTEVAIKDVQKKAQIVLATSQSVSEAREKVVEELKELHRSQLEERERFVEQMKSMAEYIEKQNREFEESMAAAAAKTTKADENDMTYTRGNMTIEEEKEKIELVGEIERQIKNEKELMVQTEKKINLYKKSFDELKRVSGMDDVKEIVQRYVTCEEETFSLFNYIQAQNQETDWTLERHARLEEEIKAYEEQVSNEETQRSEAMAALQGKWRNAKEATDECSHAALEAQRTLDRIAKRIHSLFFKIQCEQMMSAVGDSAKTKGSRKSSVAGRLPDNRLALLSGQGVTESNILAYAELIEQRALEIMADYTKRMKSRDHSIILDPSKSISGKQDYIKPPDIEAEDEILEDDDSRPIALDEMRRRTAEMLAKKQHVNKFASARRKEPSTAAGKQGARIHKHSDW